MTRAITGHSDAASKLYPNPRSPMARYAHACERVNANIAWDANVKTHANVMNVTFRPVLSIMKPRIGEATAENKYGIP